MDGMDGFIVTSLLKALLDAKESKFSVSFSIADNAARNQCRASINAERYRLSLPTFF